MFERFTDQARRVVVLAQEEARMLNHGYVGTEHILLGLIHEDTGVAARALESLGISLERVRSQVEAVIGRGQAAPTEHIPFMPQAKEVIELSLREALQLGSNYIGTEHILLGLIREGEGVGAQVLLALGADPERVRGQVRKLLMEGQGQVGATPRVARRAASIPSHPPGPHLAPMCPHCSKDLHRTLRLHHAVAHTDGPDPLRVVAILWCGACGTTISVWPEGDAVASD
jgi:ATP-dependent Clp protease ATP-binding subunit ClpA